MLMSGNFGSRLACTSALITSHPLVLFACTSVQVGARTQETSALDRDSISYFVTIVAFREV